MLKFRDYPAYVRMIDKRLDLLKSLSYKPFTDIGYSLPRKPDLIIAPVKRINNRSIVDKASVCLSNC